MGDARQGLAASLVIFWAFLGILATAAGRTTGRMTGLVNLAHILSPKETKTESANSETGDDRLAANRSLTKNRLASLCFLFSDHQGDRGAG